MGRIDKTTTNKASLIQASHLDITMCKNTRKKNNEGKWRGKVTYLINGKGHKTSLTKLIILHIIREMLNVGNAGFP